MADRSRIEWTEATWNPVTGCSEVSPGCAHCYAETFAERWRGIPGHPYEQGFDLRLWPQRLDVPLRWRRPRVVFVNSMSDLFHEDIPDDYVARVFDVMGRAELAHLPGADQAPRAACRTCARTCPGLRNVWMGVTIENRRFVHRADYFRAVPAAVRFISAEPLLGPLERLDLSGVDWLIAGGESGPRHRRIDAGWVTRPARSLRGRGRRVLLQAVGRAAFEIGGARTRGPGVERHARAARAPAAAGYRVNRMVVPPG